MGNKYKQSTFQQNERKAPEVLSNYYIRAKRIKVIDESGKFLGEFPTRVALEKAQNLDLDLIQLLRRETVYLFAVLSQLKL